MTILALLPAIKSAFSEDDEQKFNFLEKLGGSLARCQMSFNWPAG
jgi:hypothetical protein